MKPSPMSKYYDLDDLLYQEQKITVAFTHPIQIHSKRYKRNKKLELPIYIVDFFIQNDHCKPFLITEEESIILQADCTLFNFKNMFFYNFNKYLKENIIYEIFCTRMQFYSKLLYEDHVDKKVLSTLEYEEKKNIKNGREEWKKYN